MATSSISHNVVIDSPEKAKELIQAMGKAEIISIEREDREFGIPDFYFDNYTEGFLNGLGIYTRKFEETNANWDDEYPYYDCMKIPTSYFGQQRYNRIIKEVLRDVCLNWSDYSSEQQDTFEKVVLSRLTIEKQTKD